MTKLGTTFLLLAGLVAWALLLAGCGGRGTGKAPSDTLRLGIVSPAMPRGPSMPFGPIGWALSTGKLQAALAPFGIKHITCIPAKGAISVQQAFAGGELDIAVVGSTSFVVGRSAGLDYQLIAFDEVEPNYYFITRPDGPKTLQELAGKKVAVGLTSGVGWVWINGLLEAEGILDRVTPINLSKGAEQALLRGAIDATNATGEGPPPKGFRVLAESKNYPGLSASWGVLGSGEFLAAHPGLADAWRNALSQATAEIVARPDEFYAFMSKISKVPPAKLRELYPVTLWSTDPLDPRGLEALEHAKQFFLRNRVIRRDFIIADAIAPGRRQRTLAAATLREP